MSVQSMLDLMRVLQFGDSVLPVGAFSFSNGLESAIQQRIVHDVASLREFVLTSAEQAATCDGIALLVAHRAALADDLPGVFAADRAVCNRKLNEEMRTMTIRMGRKLGEMALRMGPTELIEPWLAGIRTGETPGSYPIGQALVFAAQGLREQEAFAVHHYGVASMMVGAALRLMKLHYLDGQSVLFDVNAAVTALYDRVQHRRLEEMSSFAPMLDILAASHVTSHIRMFMN